MKNKKLLLLIGILLWNINSVFGQSLCSTPSFTGNQSLNTGFQMKRTNSNSYCLKVYFHVIRRSNGTGGQSTGSVNEAFNILNQDFNPHNISFNWDETIDYIDNTTYYNNPNYGLTANTPPTIFSINNHQDGIDIYLYDDSTGGSGLANGVGNSSEFYVTGSYWKSPFNSLIRSHVISHEMGHVLYLWHTHHGTFNEGGNDNPCPELVNGSNSSTCGDYVTEPLLTHIYNSMLIKQLVSGIVLEQMQMVTTTILMRKMLWLIQILIVWSISQQDKEKE